MANKYCNLDGSKKIKDEYQKINIGFDKVEEDVNKINDDINALDERVDEIITTPVEDVSAEEIIDARGGRPVLGKRFEDIEDEIAAHKAEKAQQAHGENLELIASGTLSIAAILSLSNIPQNYKHLKLIVEGKRNTVGSNINDFGFRFNGISSESYFNQAIKAVGSTLTSERTILTRTVGRLGELEFSGRSIIEMTIYDYTSNSTKIVSSKYMVADTSLSEHGEVSTLFTLNSPVNLIETGFYLSAGTKYYLYGIRGE